MIAMDVRKANGALRTTSRVANRSLFHWISSDIHIVD